MEENSRNLKEVVINDRLLFREFYDNENKFKNIKIEEEGNNFVLQFESQFVGDTNLDFDLICLQLDAIAQYYNVFYNPKKLEIKTTNKRSLLIKVQFYEIDNSIRKNR